MWKAQAGMNVSIQPTNENDDDWETDPNFINDVTEEEQRWGSKTIEGSGRTAAALNMNELREQVSKDDEKVKKKLLDEMPKPSYGYGGKFGVQQDRMDKSAVGHDYSEKLQKHASQKDYATGFGGKYGVQADRIDKSAVGWDYKHKPEKHDSQKDYATGFGGKYGVQKDRQDKSAVGFEYHESLSKHESQKDYSTGFGGKFGVQTDRQDKSARGWDEKTVRAAHPSQTDMKIGFGGKYGIQADRVDRSAHGYEDNDDKVEDSKTKPIEETGGKVKTSALRARFENAVNVVETKPLPPVANKIVKPVRKFEGVIVQPKQIQRPVKTIEAEEEIENVIQAQPLAQRQDSFDEIKAQAPKEKQEAIDEMEKTFKTRPSSQLALEVKTESYAQERHLSDSEDEPPQDGFDEFDDSNYVPGFVAEHSNIAVTQQIPAAQPQRSGFLEEPDDEYESEEHPMQGESTVSALALYDYEAAADDELTFDPGELITNVEMIDEGWWRGECHGKVGLFPANYVELQ